MTIETIAAAAFDYGALDTESRIVVQQRTGEIKSLMRRTAQDIIDIGQKLTEVKERLGHGHFGAWLAAEFDWSEDTALRFVQVAGAFRHIPQFAEFAPSALYTLAAPSTPQAARDEAIARAQAGETISHTKAKAIVGAHSSKEPTFIPNPIFQHPESVEPGKNYPVFVTERRAKEIERSFGVPMINVTPNDMDEDTPSPQPLPAVTDVPPLPHHKAGFQWREKLAAVNNAIVNLDTETSKRATVRRWTQETRDDMRYALSIQIERLQAWQDAIDKESTSRADKP